MVSRQAVKDYLGNPSLLFAFAAALFWGRDGGPQFVASVAVMALIAACVAMRYSTLKNSRLGRMMARPATAQTLVGALSIVTAAFLFDQKDLSAMDGRDHLYLVCAFLNLASNALMARGLEKGFDNGALSLQSILLSPQVWGIIGCVAGAIYNSVYTVLGLPIMFAGVIVSVRGSLSLGKLKLEGVGMPYYLNIAYNAWFAGCNMASEHPNTLVVASCFVGGAACYSMGLHAERLAASGMRIPADQLVYIEIPGVVYRAPRLADDMAFAWEPISFDAAR